MDREIIITGVSGRFPESEDLLEFWDHLVCHTDMVTDDNRRWDVHAYDAPKRTGKLKAVDKFDAEFFSVHAKQADILDPRARIALELSHEALLDGGVNPIEIRGSKTGVFVGTSYEESFATWSRSQKQLSGYVVTGNLVSCIPNRVSFCFDLHGPSFVMDSGCSSGSVAIHSAVEAIRNGSCPSALVLGINIMISPLLGIGFYNLKAVSEEGKCRSFDASASGYARADGAVALYICSKQSSLRSYATILHTNFNNDGYKEQGFSFPSGKAQEQLLREAYLEAGILPEVVGYVEAHGTGTKAGDVQELNAITNVFCAKGRNRPLLVGSVKSNMGHSEPAAGLCGISKILLAHHAGIMPANLHYKDPHPDIPALWDGRIQVVSENMPFHERYVGCSSFGIGGANVHIILELTPKRPILPRNSNLPLLVPVSARTEGSVAHLLTQVELHGRSRNAAALLHKIWKHPIPRHPYRGYALMNNSGKANVQYKKYTVGTSRPIAFLFTGLGSQWTGMSRDLFKFAAFQESILESSSTLLNNNFSLLEVLSSEIQATLEDLKNSMVSITAFQMALVDLLHSMGITPDLIVGHSTGECAAAYADRSMERGQAALVSHARARAFLESNLPPGTVASVELTWDEAKSLCPDGVYPAIHNSENNVTIAGPPEKVREFIGTLNDQGIFAKEVKSAAYGFHSPHVFPAEYLMRELLENVIPDPKPRSSKWLSSSIPEENWNSDLAKFASVDYFVNNALSPVTFYETLKHLPENILALEIGPHCFMQTILKKSLPAPAVVLGWISRHAPDNTHFFLAALGEFHLNGGSFDPSKLYEPVEFPVGPETPMISPWIKWDHTKSWNVPRFEEELSNSRGYKFQIDLTRDSDSFFTGHVVDGRTIFPGTGYIWLVWKTLAKQIGTPYEKLNVVFENIRFERSTALSPLHETEFMVTILRQKGEFEVEEGGSVVCCGRVRTVSSGSSAGSEMFPSSPQQIDQRFVDQSNRSFLSKTVCYKILRLKGYEYSGVFQGIHSLSMDGEEAQLNWNNNWVSFLDTMLQVEAVFCEGFVLPMRIEKLTIYPETFKTFADSAPEPIVTLNILKFSRASQCPGIEFRGVKTALTTRKGQKDIPTLMEHRFLPFLDDQLYALQTSLDFLVSIAMSNTAGVAVTITEYLSDPSESIKTTVSRHCPLRFDVPVFHLVLKTDNPYLENDLARSSKYSLPKSSNLDSVVPSDLVYSDSIDQLELLEKFIKANGFLLTKGPLNDTVEGYHLVARKHTLGPTLSLFKKRCEEFQTNRILISVDDPEFGWVTALQDELKSGKNQIVLISKQKNSGILGLVSSLIREYGISDNIRSVHLKTSDTNLKLIPESSLASREYDLISSVYIDGSWGCYCNVHVDSSKLPVTRLCQEAYANTLRAGDLSSLSWVQSPVDLEPNHVKLCKIQCASLNFHDIMLATGKLARDALPGVSALDDCVLGIEYAGIFNNKRVCGLKESKCLATSVVPDQDFLWEIPEKWSFKDAATVPAVYGTVIYALFIRGNLRRGETLLIHSGSGGVGQAAIAIALHYNCTVYTTVGSSGKREFLKKQFPQLQDHNITDSRDANKFERHVMEQTQGKGVDIVLNSLAQDKLQASIRCLAEHGRFLEIGKFDLFEDTPLGMSILLKSVNIQGILLDDVIVNGGGSDERKRLVNLMQKGIDQGMIQPLPYETFRYNQLEDAFRYMASGKHMGKVLIDMEAVPVQLVALQKTYFHADKSYIIIGGLGGMGLELANWMIERGARTIVLNSRSGLKNSFQEFRLQQFSKRGCSCVVVDNSDVSTPEGALTLLKIAANLNVVGGIFNTAVALNDALFENQSASKFQAACRAKLDATRELDRASRELCPGLDYFVVFSSIVAARGNPGQTNYGFANSAMESICEMRRESGLPALAIQWGLIGEVGVAAVAVAEHGLRNLSKSLGSQTVASWIGVLESLLQQDNMTVVSSFVHNVSEAGATVNASQASDSAETSVANILGVKDLSTLDKHATLTELGMDSLMAAEVKHVLNTRTGVSLPFNTFKELTFAKIAGMFSAK